MKKKCVDILNSQDRKTKDNENKNYFDMKDDERNVPMYSICIQCLHQPGWVKGNTLLSTLFITMITMQMIEESATVIN